MKTWGRLGTLGALLAAMAAASPGDEEFLVLMADGAALEWKGSGEKPARLRLKKVEAGSHAAQLGYREGDEIVAIAGQSTKGRSLHTFLALSQRDSPFLTRRKSGELELPPLMQAPKFLESDAHGLKPGARPPPLVINPPKQKRRDILEDFEGRVVLISFWAVWCGPCMREMPQLVRLHEEYGERGVTVLSVNVDSEVQSARDYLSRNPLPFPVVVTGGMQSTNAGNYLVEAIPLNVLVARDRRIAQVLLGFRGKQQEDLLADSIETLLGAATPPVMIVRK